MLPELYALLSCRERINLSVNFCELRNLEILKVLDERYDYGSKL